MTLRLTHAEACSRRLAHVPASDCPGVLVPRRLRPHDGALRCTVCGATIRRDAAGVVVVVALRGEVQRVSPNSPAAE